MSTAPLYIPSDSINISDLEFPQIRLALQGEPGTGKTWSALTAPNVIVFDRDNNLIAHRGKKIPTIAIHSDEWCIKYCERNSLQLRSDATHPINRRDITKHWFYNEAPKLQRGQVLVVDSWSRMQDDFDKETALHPTYNAQGVLDNYAFWEQKIDYASDLCTKFGELNCHVIVTFHESRERDKKTGAVLSKMQPMMQGKFQTRLQSYFTDWYRCLVFDSLGADGQPTIQELPNGHKRKAVDYFWQTTSDSDFNGRCSINNAPSYVKDPNFEKHFMEGYAKH